MKRYFILAVCASFLISTATASAFTINFSSIRRIIAPQLSTSPLYNSLSDFSLGKNTVETVLSGSSSGTASIKDILYNYFSTGSVETTCSIIVQSNSNSTPYFSAATPSVGTINSVGSTTYASAGTAYFNVRVGSRTKSISCPFSRTNNTTSYTFNSIISTSTVKEMKDEVDARLSGETPSSTTYNIYSALNDSTHTYTRNTNLFASDVDLTCVPVLSGAINSAQTMGVLVAPDIMIQAVHSHPSGTMYFVKNDNTTVSATISSGTTITGTDIYVAKLSSPVASGINPCKVFPSTLMTNKISTTSLAYVHPPVVYTNQNRTLKVGVITSIDTTSHVNIFRGTGDYYDWYSTVCCGDSGSPAFALINGEAVLLGVWHTTFSVPNISNYITQINAAMASLGSSYSLTTVSLSGLHSF